MLLSAISSPLSIALTPIPNQPPVLTFTSWPTPLSNTTTTPYTTATATVPIAPPMHIYASPSTQTPLPLTRTPFLPPPATEDLPIPSGPPPAPFTSHPTIRNIPASSPAHSPPFPTHLLTQLPTNWPYTAYGMGRTPQTREWGVTDEAGETVGVVRHVVAWYGRAVFTRRGEGGDRGDERLRGWRSTFVLPVTRGGGGRKGEEAVETGI